MNIQGLSSKLGNDLNDFVSRFDILFMCETWSKVKANFCNSIPGYCGFDQVRNFTANDQSKGHGGIIAYLKNSISSDVQCIPSQSNNLLWILLKSGKTRLCFGCAYYSPANSTTDNSKEQLFVCIYQELLQIKLDLSPTHTYIVRDFNCRIANSIEDSDHITVGRDVLIPGECISPRTSQDKVINARGKNLLSFCNEANFIVANGRLYEDKEIGRFTCVTSNGASVVDYLLVESSAINSVLDFKVDDYNDSDHFPLLFDIKCIISDNNIDANSFSTDLTSVDQSILAPNRIKWRSEHSNKYSVNLNSDITKNKLETVYRCIESSDLNIAVENLTDIVSLCAVDMVVKTRRSIRIKSDQPWFDNECHEARGTMKSKLRHFRSQRDNESLFLYITSKAAYRRLIDEKKSAHKKFLHTELVNVAQHPNSREFWNMIKPRTCHANVIDNKTWFEYFSELHLELFKELPVPNGIVPNSNPIAVEVFDARITSSEVRMVIKNLKSNKAAGIDGIPIECWKNAHSIVPLLKELFNALYVHGFFPESWKTAIIIPVHKKGSMNDPCNYRGISLLPALGKIYIGVFNNRFLKWSNLVSFFTDCQYGYRHSRSTVDSIFTIYSIVKSSSIMSPKKYVYCAMVDFMKAYDSVPRNLLYEKLLSYGVSEKFVNMVKSMYDKIQARVRSETNCLTEAFDCPAGLRQGCILSSSLFIAYLNDIETFFIDKGVGAFNLGTKRIILQLFADDLALMDCTVVGLQMKLNILSDYCKRWGLIINKNKTKILRFKTGRKSLREKWHIDGKMIEVVDKFEYLGLVLACSNSWCHAIDKRIEKATKAMYYTLSQMRRFCRVPRKILLRIFDSQIAPILLYGCELWGLTDLARVEKVATKFYRILLSIPQNSSVDFVRGELGRRSLKLIIYKRVLNFWFKVMSANHETAIFNAYMTLYNIAERNKDCWALRVRQLLFSTGFGEVWFNQGVGNVKLFMSEFCQRIKDMENQEWRDHVSCFNTLRTYRNLKPSPSLEKYLDSDMPNKYIKLFTKLRGSLLPLECNIGRWNNVPYNERICKFCNLNQVENEYHVIFICPVWLCYRQQLVNSHPLFSQHDLVSILSTTSISVIRSLCVFLEIVIIERREMLEVL